jgi:hypothetical protein
MERCELAVKELEGGWGTMVTTTMTVNAIGRLDVYQYIVFLCRHALRHDAQMRNNEKIWSEGTKPSLSPSADQFEN